MKVPVYIDVYGYETRPNQFMATTMLTGPKPIGGKRYGFIAEIPDPALPDVTTYVTVEEVK
jgi:hypothetical protein